MRDYERLFAENKRLRELGNSLRDEKESALAEVSKLKVASHTRMTEVQDECNLKIAHLEQMLLEQKERHRAYEERAYAVISSQEQITEKWKDEHRRSVQYFERALQESQVECRHLSEQLVEQRGRVRAMQKDPSVHDMKKIGAARASKSREKSK